MDTRGSCASAPPNFRVTAFMCAYNEEDRLPTKLQHLVEQGVEIHLVDNWPTDGTVAAAEPFLGRGLRAIIKFPLEGPSPTYDWHALLSHVEVQLHLRQSRLEKSRTHG